MSEVSSSEFLSQPKTIKSNTPECNKLDIKPEIGRFSRDDAIGYFQGEAEGLYQKLVIEGEQANADTVQKMKDFKQWVEDGNDTEMREYCLEWAELNASVSQVEGLPENLVTNFKTEAQDFLDRAAALEPKKTTPTSTP